MAKIWAYRTDTGEKVQIPEHFLDHPTLGKPFRKTPSQKAKDADREAKEAAEAALEPLRQRSASQPDAPASSQPSESAASASTNPTTGAPRAAKKE